MTVTHPVTVTVIVAVTVTVTVTHPVTVTATVTVTVTVPDYLCQYALKAATCSNNLCRIIDKLNYPWYCRECSTQCSRSDISMVT